MQAGRVGRKLVVVRLAYNALGFGMTSGRRCSCGEIMHLHRLVNGKAVHARVDGLIGDKSVHALVHGLFDDKDVQVREHGLI